MTDHPFEPKGPIAPLMFIIVLAFLLRGSWPLPVTHADELANSSLLNSNGIGDDYDAVPVPDVALLPRLSPIFRGLERDLILEHTRGQKEQMIYREAAPAVVLVVTKEGMGSGIVIDNQGHILTNNHVVTSNRTVAVIFKPRNGEELTKDLARKATVEKVDATMDLALLTIENPPPLLPVLQFADSTSLEVGMDVHSIGHPYGETWTYTRGTISALRKNYEADLQGKAFRANIIQHQTPTNPGNSGGPLLNDSGQVVGINTFVKEGQGLNFAVSADTIAQFLKAPRATTVATNENAGLLCPKHEQYDLVRSGLGLIWGCYLDVRSAPPNWWVVRRNEQEAVYVAADLDHNNVIETARIKNVKQGGYLWAADTDCDGIIDAIGLQPEGSADITSYAQPSKGTLLTNLVREMASALRSKTIPHPSLKVCQ